MIMVNGFKKVDWQDGITVQQVLDALSFHYSLITVSINGDFVSEDDYSTTIVPDNSDFRAIHICHGG